MDKIKIAQIGVEHDHAADIMFCLRSLSDIFEVVGYAKVDDYDIQFSQKSKYYDGIPEMSVEELLNFPGLQAVAIESTENNLVKYALQAAEKNLHIHIDKPGGQNFEEFQKLVNVIKQQNLTMHLGYMYRFNPAVSEALQRVRQGALGEVFSVEAQMSCEHNHEKRQWLSRFQGGMMFFLGCHLIDLIMLIQGEPERIVPVNKSTAYEDVHSEDFGFACLEYKNGVSFCKTVSHEVGGGSRRQLVINGTKGTVIISPLEAFGGGNFMMSSTLSEIYKNGGGWKKTTFEKFSRYNAMLEHFSKVVKGEIENEFTPDYELNVYKNILKASNIEIN